MPEEPFGFEENLEDLWRKAESSSSEFLIPLSGEAHAFPSQVAWDALSLVRQKSRREAEELSELLSSRYKALEESRQREAILKGEIQNLKSELSGQEAAILSGGLEAEGKIEAALKSIEEERKSHAIEKEKLKSLLAQTRERLSEQQKIIERQEEMWQKKEEEYLQSLREMQALTGRTQKESSTMSSELSKSSQSLREAKTALEKTLAELLEERHRLGEAEKDKAQALKKVSDLEKHLEELSKIWEQERAEWRELWDRERSAWQNQRAELSSWEENLRKERENWHADLEKKEAEHLRFTEAMNESVRESAEATAKLSSFMKRVSEKVEKPSLAFKMMKRKGFWFSLIACASLGAGGYQVWNYLSRFHFRALSVQPVSLSSPTGLAFDGTLLWASDWDGDLKSFSPQKADVITRTAKVLASKPYHPSSLTFAKGNLWSLDAAQARLIEHSPTDPAVVSESYPTPGPAPTALAFNGKSLWSYDAVNGLLYRHGSDPTQIQAFSLGSGMAVTAMAWVQGQLWAFDSKARELLVFKRQGSQMLLKARYPAHQTILGIVPSGKRQVLILAGPGAEHPTPILIRYSY